MSVYDNIDFVLFHNAKVCLCVHRLRGTEQNVGKLGSHHGTSPSVRQTGTQGLANQSLRLGRTSHMSHMHRAGYLAVDRMRSNFLPLPDLLGMLRSTFQETLGSERLSILHQTGLCNLVSQIVDISSLCLNSPLFRNTNQFLRIFYFVIAVCGRRIQGMADLTSVVGVSRRSSGRETKEVSSYNAVYVTSANSSWRLRSDPTRSHRTDPAAGSFLAEFTVWALFFYAELPRISANFCTCLQKTAGSLFKLFYGRQFEFTHYDPP